MEEEVEEEETEEGGENEGEAGFRRCGVIGEGTLLETLT